jgi:hypothetical protein
MGVSELKEMCNKIVGHWYCEEIKQHFIFSLNDRLLRESPVVIMNSKSKIPFEPFETVYGVAIRVSPEATLDTKYYFDMGMWEWKRYYDILSLTKDMLVIQEFYMRINPPPSPPPLIYVRQTDLSAADEILKGIDLGE